VKSNLPCLIFRCNDQIAAKQEMDDIANILLKRSPLPPLAPRSVFNLTLTPKINLLNTSNNVRAGLHLLNDDINSAHEIAQSMEGDPIADYWHAILHRREKDYWNSKYWINKVKCTAMMLIFNKDSMKKAQKAAEDFVDKCEVSEGQQNEELENQQYLEMKTVLEEAIKSSKT
jgi:hypothetical protein